MNNNHNYIILKELNNNNYEIVINLDGNRIKLNNKETEYMRSVLNKFPYHQINKNTFIFPDCSQILKTYNKLKEQKKKPKKVNRTKSKNVLVTTLAASIILTVAIAGTSIYHGYKNEQQQEKILEIVNNNAQKLDQLVESITLEQDEINNDIYYDEDFHYYFEQIGDKEALDNAKNYEEIFKKYEKMYGIDKDLLCAIAAQESSGTHKNYSENGHALGLMGIENIWANAEVEVYNFNSECWEIFKIDYDKVGKDVDYNIKVGTAIFQSRFNENIKKNIVPPEELLAYTIQSYNMGQGNMNEISTTGSHWIDSRIMVEGGDKLYFEHVFSRLENDTIINIKQKNGQYLSTKLTNEATKLKTKSL